MYSFNFYTEYGKEAVRELTKHFQDIFGGQHTDVVTGLLAEWSVMKCGLYAR